MGPVDHHKGRLAESEGRQPRRTRGDFPADTVLVTLPWFPDSSMHAPCSSGRAFAICGDGGWMIPGGKAGRFTVGQVVKAASGARTLGLGTESRKVVTPRDAAWEHVDNRVGAQYT
jgi:hypothetical protein